MLAQQAREGNVQPLPGPPALSPDPRACAGYRAGSLAKPAPKNPL